MSQHVVKAGSPAPKDGAHPEPSMVERVTDLLFPPVGLLKTNIPPEMKEQAKHAGEAVGAAAVAAASLVREGAHGMISSARSLGTDAPQKKANDK